MPQDKVATLLIPNQFVFLLMNDDNTENIFVTFLPPRSGKPRRQVTKFEYELY